MSHYSKSIEKILDYCILDIQSGRRTIEECLRTYPEIRDELEPLLYLSIRVTEAPKLTTAETYKSVAKVRLLNQIKSHPKRKAIHNQSNTLKGLFPSLFSGWGRLRVSGLAILVLIITFFLGGVLTASAKALPGEPFYKTKIILEQVQLSISQSEINKSYLYLKFASKRINEASLMVQENKMENLDELMIEYSKDIAKTLTILFESDAITEQERVALAAQLIENLETNEAQILHLLSFTNSVDRRTIVDALTLSRYGHDIVLGIVQDSPWRKNNLREGRSGLVTITPNIGAEYVPTILPDSEIGGELDQRVEKYLYSRWLYDPYVEGTPFPMWDFDPSEFMADQNWPVWWPTPVRTLTAVPTLTEFPPTRSAHSDRPTEIPTSKPRESTRMPPERTPRPPRP